MAVVFQKDDKGAHLLFASLIANAESTSEGFTSEHGLYTVTINNGESGTSVFNSLEAEPLTTSSQRSASGNVTVDGKIISTVDAAGASHLYNTSVVYRTSNTDIFESCDKSKKKTVYRIIWQFGYFGHLKALIKFIL